MILILRKPEIDQILLGKRKRSFSRLFEYGPMAEKEIILRRAANATERKSY